MEDFFGWLTKFNAPTVIVMLSLALLIVAMLKLKGVSEIIKFIFKNKIGRTCGDCVLILFGMSEKYHTESLENRTNILRNQMSYFEQKSQEIFLWLIQSFQDDLLVLGNGKSPSLKVSQFGNYQEALKNAMTAVKNETRKAFKENGFVHMSDVEFDNYVKSKLKTLVSIAQTYLSTYYSQSDEIIVSLKYRYDKLDLNKLSEVAFDVFEKAKMIELESISKAAELKSTFKKDVDNFTGLSGKG
jgi:hypothetical protein